MPKKIKMPSYAKGGKTKKTSTNKTKHRGRIAPGDVGYGTLGGKVVL
jgi:hypothetical protein